MNTIQTLQNKMQVSETFSYVTSGEGKVNQMWIEQIGDNDCDNKYVAVAYNPEKNTSMVMSNARTSYQETLNWVRMFCGSFSILPAFL
jgi:hypothetical protein